jgi:hypothetical protein
VTPSPFTRNGKLPTVRAAINTRLEELRFRSVMTVLGGAVALIAVVAVGLGLPVHQDRGTKTTRPEPTAPAAESGPARPPASAGPTRGVPVPAVAPKHSSAPKTTAVPPSQPKTKATAKPKTRPDRGWTWQYRWDRRHSGDSGEWPGHDHRPGPQR